MAPTSHTLISPSPPNDSSRHGQCGPPPLVAAASASASAAAAAAAAAPASVVLLLPPAAAPLVLVMPPGPVLPLWLSRCGRMPGWAGAA